MAYRKRMTKSQKTRIGIIEHPKKFEGVAPKDVRKKEKLREQLYERDGTRCHYCGIEEKEFTSIWKKKFYGSGKRGRRLELDRKDNKQGYTLENSVLACALCNMAKSDFLTYDEFKKVGNVIREIWQQRKNSARSVTA